MMTFVPPHINMPGRFIRNTTGKWEVRSYASDYGPLNGVSIDAISIKSPTVKGLYHPLIRNFRMCTAYTRAIARNESLVAPHFYAANSEVGGWIWHYKGTTSVHPSGIAMSSAPGFNNVSGRPNVPDGIINRAIAEARNKIADQKINLSVTAAESVKTIEWLVKVFNDLVKALRYFKRRQYEAALGIARWSMRVGLTERRPKKMRRSRIFEPRRIHPLARSERNSTPRHQRRSPTSMWLEYWYAFMPLVYDVYGAFELAKEGLRPQDQVFKVERTVRQAFNPRILVTNPTNWHSFSGKSEYSAKVTLFGRVTSQFQAFNSLGLTNPWTVAWELTPFSFVIDWLVPIGTWIASITATSGVAFVDGHLVRKTEADVTVINHRPSTGVTRVDYPHALPRSRIRVLAMERTVYKEWPIAMPYLRNPFSTNHTITALALFRELRR